MPYIWKVLTDYLQKRSINRQCIIILSYWGLWTAPKYWMKYLINIPGYMKIEWYWHQTECICGQSLDRSIYTLHKDYIIAWLQSDLRSVTVNYPCIQSVRCLVIQFTCFESPACCFISPSGGRCCVVTAAKCVCLWIFIPIYIHKHILVRTRLCVLLKYD